MADTKITALTAITTVDPAVDVFPIVDVSDTTMAASGTTKKITSNQLLGAGGTATLASATVTGNATAAAFIPSGSTVPTNGTYLPSANTIGWAVNSTNAMTLNSTGLGVGGSPVNPITAYAAASAKAPALLLTTAGSPTYGWDFSVDGAVNGNLFIRRLVAGTKTDVLEFDRATGNLGLGVTPSAWGLGSSGYRAFEIGAIGNSIFSATNDLNISSNAYYLAGWKYGASSYASQYSQGSGKHIWYTASSGTAGNAITFTQAMTLDASGNLCVGTATAVRKLTVYDTTATPAQFESSTTDCQLTLVTSSGSGGKCFIQASAGALLLGSSASERARIDANGNFMVGVSAAGTTAAKTIQIANGTAPTANITGGQLYVEAGALKYRGSSGTVTTIANA